MPVWHRTDARVLDGGFFYCPKCKASAEYRQIGLTQPSWVDIWFWTVNKSKSERVSEYVECCVCECRFEASTLRPDTQKLLRLVAEVVVLCRRGIPYNAIRARILRLCGSEYITDRALQIALSQ
jgi:hypothetical protein